MLNVRYLCFKLKKKISIDMKNKNGTSFWPKPIVHPMLDNKFETYILDNPCGFCNKGYYCHDIAIAFYKHTFHPFCLGELLKVINKCFICAQVFHPDWWRNWGLQEEEEEDEDEDVKNLAMDMCVDKLRAKMKQTLVKKAFCP